MRDKKIRILVLAIMLIGLITSCTTINNGDNLKHRNDVEVTNCTYEMLQGMEYDQETGLYVVGTEDKWVSFDYYISGSEEDLVFFDSFNKDLCQFYEDEIYNQVFGEKSNVEILKFETYEIDGLPTYRYDIQYMADGADTIYTVVMVGANKIYNFCYEQSGTNQYGDAVEESIKTIHFEYEIEEQEL